MDSTVSCAGEIVVMMDASKYVYNDIVLYYTSYCRGFQCFRGKKCGFARFVMWGKCEPEKMENSDHK
jgi:hypothetical protein